MTYLDVIRLIKDNIDNLYTMFVDTNRIEFIFFKGNEKTIITVEKFSKVTHVTRLELGDLIDNWYQTKNLSQKDEFTSRKGFLAFNKLVKELMRNSIQSFLSYEYKIKEFKNA